MRGRDTLERTIKADTNITDCYSALAGAFGAVDNMLSDCEGIDTCDNNKKPDWYGIPMKLNGESEQEKILVLQNI